MKKLQLIILALLSAFVLPFACGDDARDIRNSDAGTDTDSDGDGDGDGDGDPFADFDCETEDVESCDYTVCAQKEALNLTMDKTDCSEVGQDVCDAIINCYGAYVGCFTDPCKPGDAVADADAEVLAECLTDMGTCQSDAEAGGDSNIDEDDPYADYDCETDDKESCDYAACAEKEAFDDDLDSLCSEDGQDVCDAAAECHDAFMVCIRESCDPGESATEADEECSTDMDDCLNDI